MPSVRMGGQRTVSGPSTPRSHASPAPGRLPAQARPIEPHSAQNVEPVGAHAVGDDPLLAVLGLRFLVAATADQAGYGADAGAEAGIAADGTQHRAAGGTAQRAEAGVLRHIVVIADAPGL